MPRNPINFNLKRLLKTEKSIHPSGLCLQHRNGLCRATFLVSVLRCCFGSVVWAARLRACVWQRRAAKGAIRRGLRLGGPNAEPTADPTPHPAPLCERRRRGRCGREFHSHGDVIRRQVLSFPPPARPQRACDIRGVPSATPGYISYIWRAVRQREPQVAHGPRRGCARLPRPRNSICAREKDGGIIVAPHKNMLFGADNRSRRKRRASGKAASKKAVAEAMGIPEGH